MHKNTLLIHIGTPKTGSSSIQHFCYQNNELLMSYGWCYPRFEDFFNKQYHEINGGVFCYPDEFHLMDKNHPRWEAIWDNILHYLKSYSVLLSNEVFWYHENRKLLKEAVKRWENVKVLVYLRRQDLYFESLYMNLIREGETKSFNEWMNIFLSGNYKTPDTEHIETINYLQELRDIEELVGIENMHVRTFDKTRWRHGSLIEDFMDVLGIKGINEREITEDVIENRALSMEKLELYRELNRSISQGERNAWGFFRSSGTAKLDALFYPDMDGKKKYLLMNSEQRKEIWKRFKKENEEIASRYRDGKELFEYKMPDGVVWQPMLSDMQREMVKSAFKLHLKEYAEMHRYSVLLTIRALCGDRRLALYGIGKCGKEILEKYILPFEIVIDNDPHKGTQVPPGLEVISSDEVEDWKSMFFVIAIRDSDEIEMQMKGHHLIRNKDYVLGIDFFELVNWDMSKFR